MSNDANNTELVIRRIYNILTLKDVNTVAQRFFNDKFVQVLNYNIADYSVVKQGFAGDHSSLKITLKKSSECLPKTFNFFVKSLSDTCKKQTELLKKHDVFSSESSFFETILPQLLQNCEGEKWYPVCYFAKKNVLVLEDLNLQGYKVLENIFDNFAALKSVLASLARFHGCSILEEARLNENSKSPVTLNQRYPKVLDEKIYIPNESIGWVESSVDVACAIAQSLGYDADKIRKTCSTMPELVQPSKIHRNVIGHGDLWKNNFMFDESSPLQKCIILDYQLIRYAPLVLDLLNLMHLNATQMFRDEHEVELIEFYYSVLEETVRNNDSTKKANLPTLEDVFAGMDDLRVFGLVLAALYYPLVLLDPKVIAHCLKDSFDQFLLGNRVDFTLAYMKQNKRFEKMVEEAVTQLVKRIEYYSKK